MKNWFLFLLILISALVVEHIGAEENALDFLFNNTQEYKDVVVRDVQSVGRIVLASGEKVRLIGLKAPEVLRKKEAKEFDEFGFPVKEHKEPFDPIEEQAFEFVQELLEGKRVRLEFDVEKKDEDAITLAYVFLLDNNLFVNAEIIRQGYAHLRIQPPNTKYAEELRGAYREAKREQRGLQNE
jgi:endonuclease YncB( thermonuclease family)